MQPRDAASKADPSFQRSLSTDSSIDPDFYDYPREETRRGTPLRCFIELDAGKRLELTIERKSKVRVSLRQQGSSKASRHSVPYSESLEVADTSSAEPKECPDSTEGVEAKVTVAAGTPGTLSYVPFEVLLDQINVTASISRPSH